MEQAVVVLTRDGFVRIDGLRTSDEALETAQTLLETHHLEDGLPPLTILGDFIVPPLEGGASRDFQTLHFDFGLPLDPKVEQDVARYTALHLPSGKEGTGAATRLVPLGALLGQRRWPAQTELVERLVRYSKTHGAWDDMQGYVEGSLARIVEAAGGSTPALPSVKLTPGFMCGMEFDSLAAEDAFFERHGLRVGDVQIEIVLEGAELLVFDNLRFAHGRRGSRQPGELRQRVFGHAAVPPARQLELRDRVLSAFDRPPQTNVPFPSCPSPLSPQHSMLPLASSAHD